MAATFIEEAQSLLSADKFNRFELVRIKSNNFESSQEEEKEFYNLKNEVRTLISQRDKDKNLQFIVDPSISIIDILRVKKTTREEINKAVKVLFPTELTVTETIATIPYKNKAGKDVVFQIKMGNGLGTRLDREASRAVQVMGVKGFIKHLTEFGKEYILKNHVADGGPKSGQTVYDNIPAIALKFKFKPEDIRKELKIQ